METFHKQVFENVKKKFADTKFWSRERRRRKGREREIEKRKEEAQEERETGGGIGREREIEKRKEYNKTSFLVQIKFITEDSK